MRFVRAARFPRLRTGKVFGLTGSYDAAFVNGIGWNLLNLAIATALLLRVRRRLAGPALT